MTESFSRLFRAIPAPRGCVERPVLQQFAAVEAQLGLSLPEDFKELIRAYGTGGWLDFLFVLNPFSANEYLNLLEKGAGILEAERTIRNRWPDETPYPLYPEPGGLLPWGITANGDAVHWLTAGEPNSWPTVICEARGPEHELHRMTCCDFIRGWALKELQVGIFPDCSPYGPAGPFRVVA